MPVLVKKSWSQDALVLKMFVDSGLIRKSGRTWHTGANQEMGWGPEELFASNQDHPHYDEFGLGTHHPAFGFNPATGELEEDSLHPIDAVMADLGRIFKSLGWPEHITPRLVMQQAIDTHNDHHDEDSLHRYENVDSVLHRRNYMIPYPEKGSGTMPHEHMVRGKDEMFPGGPRPHGTYYTSKGDIAHPSASKGMKIDSGVFAINKSLGAILWHLNKQMGEGGYQTMTDNEIDKLPYVKNPHVPPHLMTNGRVKNLGKHDVQYMSESGVAAPELLPEDQQFENLSDEEKSRVVTAFGLMHAGVPRAFTSMATRNLGGVASETGGKNAAIEAFREAGLELSEEEMKMFLKMPLAKILYSQPGEGVPKSIMNNLFAEHGLSPDHDRYKAELRGLRSDGQLGAGGKGRNTYARRLAALGRAVGHEAFRNSEHIPNHHEWNEEGQAVAEKVLTHMLDHHGLDPHDYDVKYPPTESPHLGQPGHDYTGIPNHYLNHIASHGDLAPHTSQQEADRREIEEKTPPPAPAPAPPADPPMAPPPIQQPTAPAPTLPPAGIGGPPMAPPPQLPPRMPLNESMTLLRSRDDIVNAMSDIQKAMEEIQLSQAANDGEVRKHVKPLVDLYSTETALFAKNLGLTSNDVRAIGATKGDWGRIAKQWNVSELTVKVIKTSIGGV